MLFNSTSKINLKTLFTMLGISLFLVIPNVLAVAADDVSLAGNYRFFIVFSGIGSAVIAFIQRRYTQFKRLCDFFAAVCGLILSAPLLLLCAVLIKVLSPNGPVLYSQIRVGQAGRIFRIFKLRTMIPDAEKHTGAVWANDESDPRCIRFIGQFLRKTHIDELPQLYNVFIGDMSIIGPRPERPEIVEKISKKISGYENRLRVKPGITGLAQVHSRYDRTLKDVKRKVKFDLLYIRRMCLWVEVNILLKTVAVIFTGKTA